MFWQEDEDKTLPYQAADDVLDMSFAISCKRLPLDHAWALSAAIQAALPWFDEDAVSGVHPIHVAESGNGWMRPEDSTDEFLIPSRRTRLLLRIPKQRQTAVMALSGQTLDIDGHPLTIGAGKAKPFSNASVLFARYVLSAENEPETDFLQRMADEIRQIADFKVKKLMCGKSYTLHTPAGSCLTKHLMIADLDNDPSIRIQQYGLGAGRKLGCGLFMPHKGIKTLKPTE
ncbi:MAG: type I-MYXAN CRISPR-associated protein Cas6/Cmx6 [Thiolinea sp.]